MKPPASHPVPTRTLRLTVAAAADAAHTWRGPRPTSPTRTNAEREGQIALLLELVDRFTGYPQDHHTSRDAPFLRVLAIGPTAEVDHHPAAAGAARVNAPDHVALPGLVNAHTHLDLTHVGPQPHDPGEGFVAWVDRIRAARWTSDHEITESVRAGADLLLRGGTVAVGDIAGAPEGRPSLVPWRTLAGTPLRGVSYLEFFAIGTREASAIGRVASVLDEVSSDHPDERENEAAHRLARVRLGLQPHATNTVSPNAYRWAMSQARARNLPISTHLAETPEEREFIAQARGPQREMLERFGLWTDDLLGEFGLGRHPIDHVLGALQFNDRKEVTVERDDTSLLFAHVNDCGGTPAELNDREAERLIERLARSGASVAYCPRASAYFAAPSHFGPHRWRDMLAAGVNVCIGTDSIVNLPPGTGTTPGPLGDRGISVLDELRLLAERDSGDPGTLLGMATIRGARALGLPGAAFGLSHDCVPWGLVLVGPGMAGGGRGGAVPDDACPVRWALGAGRTISLLLPENWSGFAGMIAR